MDLRKGLSRSLRLIRKTKGFAQEHLSEVSGRTYLSEVERGLKNPTLEKIDELARAMGVHPLTLLSIAYVGQLRDQDLLALQERVAREARELFGNADLAFPRKARPR
jgi:transcriptional regulator with XRE-family HTH domain